MLFFRAENDPKDACVVEEWLSSIENEEPEEHKRFRTKAPRRIQRATQTLQGTTTREEICFISDLEKECVVFGVAAPSEAAATQVLRRYLLNLDLDIGVSALDEITYNEFMGLADNADAYNYVRDADSIRAWLELEDLPQHARRFGRPYSFSEFLLEKPNRKDIFANASHLLMQSEFTRELERIYEPRLSSFMCGHPMHYTVLADDRKTGEEATKLLLEALLDNERIRSRRVCVMGIKHERYDRIEEEELLALYHMNQGGTVVIDLLPTRDSTADEFASAEQLVIEQICNLALLHRHEVLTILRLPAGGDRVKNAFKECLGGLTMLELYEETVDAQRAKEYLCSLAKVRGAVPNEELFARLDAGTGYNGAQLTNIFEEWYSVQLRISVYPQYAAFSAIGNNVLQDKSTGDSYEELQGMIGLADVKEVVDNALNYYKYQSLCARRGLSAGRPAMHMCFTGSPGTAKTTVARLLSKIMRDNQLLASGQFVEVGRGDLVGKYVGWTAPLVQRKFREARGGVLFIDEAYSLVDDRDGMYGDEAINTIVQEMENSRDQLVVILAGYPDKMEGLLDKNPGLRSRIAFHMHFPDYDENELVAIARFCANQYGVHLSEDTDAVLHSIMAQGRLQENFGNGRFVRNVIEQARMHMATRLVAAGSTADELTDTDLITVCAADLQDIHAGSIKKRTIGFCS